jgi:hypothetical protein
MTKLMTVFISADAPGDIGASPIPHPYTGDLSA